MPTFENIAMEIRNLVLIVIGIFAIYSLFKKDWLKVGGAVILGGFIIWLFNSA